MIKPYEKYKNSGIQWIGEIPENWMLTKAKFCSSFRMGQTILKEELIKDGKYPVFSATEGDHYFGRTNNPSFILEVGDIVIPARGNSIGYVALVHENAVSTQTTIANFIDKQKINSHYLYYFYKGFRKTLFHYDNTAIPQITVEQVKQNPILLPTFQEQTAIARYLDYQTGIIDELISQKEKLIELLKEKRQAVINEAVTKGLNPDAKMKDSGIQWLGEIPEEWEVVRLRFLGKCQNGVSAGSEYFGEGDPFVNYSDVYKNAVLPSKVLGLAKSTESDKENYSVLEGDIFFTRTSETVEEIGLSSVCLESIENSVFAGFLIRFRPKNNLLFNGFSKYFFRSHIPRIHFVKEMNLVTRASLSQELLKSLPVCLPPFKVQKEIGQFLDKKVGEMDDIKISLQAAIHKLKEYRQSVISEAVTGKIDVLAWQAPNSQTAAA